MGGRGASSGTTNAKQTADGKFTVGNTYRIVNENAGVDYDYVVTDLDNKTIVAKITDFRQGFFNQYEGATISFQKDSIAYNQATLLKESDRNAKARGNKMRKEIQTIRNKLDKAGIKYPAGSGLEQLRERYNILKKAGRIK